MMEIRCVRTGAPRRPLHARDSDGMLAVAAMLAIVGALAVAVAGQQAPFTVRVTVQVDAGRFEQGGSGARFVDSTAPTEEFSIHVHPDWAPIGASRFAELVALQFFDEARFFRVVPDFMCQFGLPANPGRTSEYGNILDDPVMRSNTRGYVSFAKTELPNSRSTQIFINYKDNSFLDDQGFAPFGFVEPTDMAVVNRIYSGYLQQPQQPQIRALGNSYLRASFP